MMRFFKPKPPIALDEFEWMVACFAWLRTILNDSDITPEFAYPGHPALAAANTAQELFEAVRDFAGMAEWDCRLEKVADDFDTGDIRIQPESSGIGGTFSVEETGVVIRYSDSMLRNPDALAAVFAHELCHYLLANAGDPPGGPDLMEHSTDCAATYIGFGIFQANAARSFEQWTDGEWAGWRASWSGYLSEQALVTGAAIFAELHGHETDRARAALKPYLQKDFDKALKAVRYYYPDLSRSLQDVDLLDWNYS
jgi:hypothetical protein